MCGLRGLTIKSVKMKPKKSISIKCAPRLHRQSEQSTRSLVFKQKRTSTHDNHPIETKKQFASKQQQQPQHLANAAGAANKVAHTCSGCNKLIKREKYLLSACDKFWHESCLKCDQCHAKLGELGSSLFVKSDLILCRQDFLDLFGPSCVCAVCEKLIRASEMVMRAKHNVYHLECFACQLCNQRFCVGDQFYLLENKVVCQYDYEDIQRSVQLTEQQHSAIELELDFSSSSTSNQIQTNVVPLEFREDQPLNQQQQQQQQPASVLQELTAAIHKPRVMGNDDEEADEEEEVVAEQEEEDDQDTDETLENENDELATLVAAGKLPNPPPTCAGLTSEVNEASPVVVVAAATTTTDEEELIILAAGRKNE